MPVTYFTTVFINIPIDVSLCCTSLFLTYSTLELINDLSRVGIDVSLCFYPIFVNYLTLDLINVLAN